MGQVAYYSAIQAVLSLKYLKDNDDIRIHKICAGNDDIGFENITKLREKDTNVEDFLEYVNNLRVFDQYHIIIQGVTDFPDDTLKGEFIIKYFKEYVDIKSENSEVEDALEQTYLNFLKENLDGVLISD